MRAADIMTTGVVAVPSGTPAETAWQTMRDRRIHHLIVGSGGKPIGIVSERDLGGRHGASIRRGRPVDDLMTRDVVTVDSGETVRKIANVMRGRSIGCVLVVEKRKTKGIITVSDVLSLIGRGVERPMSTATRVTLHHRVPHRKMPRADGLW